MKRPYVPMFKEYFSILSKLDPTEVMPVLMAMSDFCLDGVEFDMSKFSPMAQVCLLGVKAGLEKSREIQRIRAKCGAKGGLAGKGVSRNVGNTNASKSIAKQKQNNSKSIPKIEGEGEVEEEDHIIRSENKIPSFDLVLKYARKFKMDYEVDDIFDSCIEDIYDQMIDNPNILNWQRYLVKAINQRREDGSTGIIQ